MISGKDIVLKTINREDTPRPPVSLLSGWSWMFKRNGLNLEEVLSLSAGEIASLVVETNKEVNSDIVWIGSGFHNLFMSALGGSIKFRPQGPPDIKESFYNGDDRFSSIDLGRIDNDPGILLLREAAGQVVKLIGDKTLVGASQWGPFTLAGLIYGVENLMRDIYKNPDQVHRIIDFSTEIYIRYVEGFVKKGVGIVSIADPNASGDMISKDQFRNFALPYITKAAKYFRNRGVNVLLHICGNTTNRVDLISGSGVDIFSVDYKVPVRNAVENAGGNIAIAGNMNPVTIMQNSDPEGVKYACSECLSDAGSNRFILMPGCDIPPSVPVENIRAMIETAHLWKKENYV